MAQEVLAARPGTESTESTNLENTGTQIEFKNIRKVFYSRRGKEIIALDNVSLDVQYNEFFTLLGPSGCGKTTLLRILAGLEDPSKGTVLLEGDDISHTPPYKRMVNTVFQNYALFPHMTVSENVAFGLKMLGIKNGKLKDRVDLMLSNMQLPEMANRYPRQLSGGQQQRVALARALAPQPKVLLLDEPLSALDRKLRTEMRIEMKRIQRRTATTFIFVTHDQDEALTMSDRIAVMDHGSVQQIGDPADIYDNPSNRFVADFIGEMNFIQVRATGNSQGDKHEFISPGNGIKLFAEANKIGIKTGDELSLAIRPERIQICAQDKMPDFNVINCVIENVIFSGDHTVFIVRSKANGLEMKIRRQADDKKFSGYSIGLEINISLPVNHLRVLIK